MQKILLHICCAPCASYVFQELKKHNFNLTAFFYNPNIYPEKEYQIRRDEVKRYCEENQINFIEQQASYQDWKEKIKGLENEPEGGRRCELCYKIRLEKTAQFAQENEFEFFETTLSISPHKDFVKIKKIGDNFAKKFNIEFYGQNWKKADGFKKSCELSQTNNFYRQNYCGCEFSFKHPNI